MAVTLTTEQKQAVENRGGKLLVSAAAGSGKTKVLVDRLMSYILDVNDPANIDDFLIITYTKAAASELRGKIAAKLSELIAENPQNKHLQHQMQRLYLAKISTVHGFCGDLIRQYAYRLDISSDFRVADEGECAAIQLKALEQVLNDAYKLTDDNTDFYAFIDSQGLGRDDRQIPEIILKVYNSARCHLNPDAWLDWCIQTENETQDAAQTSWGRYLVEDFKQYLSMQIESFKLCISACECEVGFEKPASLFADTVAQLQALYNCKTWDEIYNSRHIDFGRLTFSKNISNLLLADQMKAVRNECKDSFAKHISVFTDNSSQVLSDLKQTLDAAKGLIALVRSFSKEYSQLKKSRNILDFSDLEHLTLDLLRGKNRNTITTIASEIGKIFREVLVDEYQDSNEIQDAIFDALTDKRQNCFMVGDVKQSIYQFRLADPDIFIHKYNHYALIDDAKPLEGRKVLLSKNFRSSQGVISAVNDIFTQCMSVDVGGLQYGKSEELKEGTPHIPLNDPEVSLYGLEVNSDTYGEESEFVADKICSLLDGSHMVRDGEKLRAVRPEDIVILLRSPGSVGSVFQDALQKRGICCVTGDSTDLLHTEEIATIRSILQIINNPLQDIPLAAVLTSKVFGFTANDLAILRSDDRNVDLYSLLCKAVDEKSKNFLNVLTQLRMSSRFSTITELLSEIFEKTNVLTVYGGMTDGEIKSKNLQTLFRIASEYETNGSKDLARFLEFLDASEERGLAGAASQQEKGAVTIMSIHKSKGLEFPIVFMCGLSRSFNQESSRAQVLCHKELGLGLECSDTKLRVRYPSIAKKAISTRIMRESISEEMRVLYVALTRARDRLIMTYASKNLAGKLDKIALRLDMCSNSMLASEADCPGWWVLQSALTRTEAGALFDLSVSPNCSKVRDTQWFISVVKNDDQFVNVNTVEQKKIELPDHTIKKLSDALAFSYPYRSATEIPSKLTATQLKGRTLDTEVSDGSQNKRPIRFRKAGSAEAMSGISVGNAVHTALQYIQFRDCGSIESIRREISRLAIEHYITPEQADAIDAKQLFAFFDSKLGKQIRESKNVLREYKFSVLDDARNYYPGGEDEKILLQGVVDLALIEDDGIIVLDFKTDDVTQDTLSTVSEGYKSQVLAYVNALTRIFQKPIKSAHLYFFSINRFVDIL